ncbi:hypothetical protein MMC14_008937 [Varicellaria rhodocarpa]|nr:hypothetical protein [Varicellaria rhodocarpa]
MLSLRFLLSISLFFACLSALAIAEPSHEEKEKEADREACADLEAFQRLLDQVDPPALHAALHDYSPKKFQHGIFKEDQTAIEAVHRDDAPLATSIALLARRQEAANTSTVVIVSSATATLTVIGSTVTESINPSTLAPNPVEPSSRSTIPATPSAQPATSVPASSVVVVTQTSGVTTTITPVSSAAVSSVTLGPGPVSLPSSFTAGQVITTTSAGVVMTATLSSRAVITTTNAAGVTIVSTIDGGVITPSGPSASASAPSTGSTAVSKSASAIAQPSHTSIVLHTTTLANGAQTTITTAVVVQASNTEGLTPTGSAGAGATSGSSTATPGLQTGLAPRSRGWGWEVVGVLGGAVGVAMAL